MTWPLRMSLRPVIVTVRLLMLAAVRVAALQFPAFCWSLAFGELRGTEDSRYART